MDGWMDGGFLKWGYPAENFHYKPSILGTSPFSYIILYIYIHNMQDIWLSISSSSNDISLSLIWCFKQPQLDTSLGLKRWRESLSPSVVGKATSTLVTRGYGNLMVFVWFPELVKIWVAFLDQPQWWFMLWTQQSPWYGSSLDTCSCVYMQGRSSKNTYEWWMFLSNCNR